MAGTKAYFDGLASVYDEEAAAVGWVANDALRGELAGIPAPASVLDLACGTGHTLAALRQVFPGARLMGVDVSPAMAAAARSAVAGTEVVVGDVTAVVDTWDRRFDLVTAVGGLEFVPDLPDVLAGMERLVRPGGRLIVTYEPLLDGPGAQGEAVTVTPAGHGAAITTFRWTPDMVAEALADWTWVADHEVDAYQRDGVPVRYRLVHVRRPG